jgi:periplasmic divalent cation tolerance protein
VSEPIVQIQVVHDDRAALDTIVGDLVTEKLIACGQIMGPITSTFQWDNAIQREEEWLALLKTSRTAVEKLVARLAEVHSYEVPEILILDVSSGYRPYLDWVIEQTSG